jgi:hypothetical protein
MNLNSLFESDFNKKPQQGLKEGEVYDLEKEYGYEKPKHQPRRSAPSDYPYSQEQDDDYFREIFRKKREAAKKAEQDGEQGMAEAKKKDELEPEVRDVALQRAISRAKAEFPAAGSGIEALAKDFMRSQEQDQKSFDQIRQAERRQDQMLSQINKIDQDQAQELQGLEKQNSGLSQRLQQLQSVNSELEKKLAAMSGRLTDKKNKAAPASAEPVAKEPETKIAPVEPVATKSNIKPVAKNKPAVKRLPAPGAQAFGSMTPALAAAGNPQQSLFPNNYAQDSANMALRKVKQDAQDIDFKDVASIDKLRKLAQREIEPTDENKESKPERPEADYDDPKWDAMVKRVGQKAKEGPRKTVWDPVKRVYKTVPVNK